MLFVSRYFGKQLLGEERLIMEDKHHREPIKHTCPDIDKYIKWIKMEIVKDRDLQRMDEKELLDAASSMSNQLEACID